MKKQDDDFVKKLLSTFRIEAKEHIKALSSGLIELEKVSLPEKQAEIVETIFREAHSLKGAARAVNVTEIESICQSMESVFSALKRREIVLSAGMFDVLHRAVDSLERLSSSLDAGTPAGEKSETDSMVRQVEDLLKGVKTIGGHDVSVRRAVPGTQAAIPPTPAQSQSKESGSGVSMETVRIPVSRLDSILLQAEEMLSAKLAVGQLSADLRRVGSTISSLRKEWRGIQSEFHSLLRTLEKNGNRDGLQQDGARVRKLSDFFKSNDAFIRSVDGEMRTLLHSANQDHRSISTLLDALLDDIKKTLMLPFSTVLEIFPKFVRDLSRDQGKEIELTVRGADAEADKRILEEIKDPLMHLVRNCVDHGVEKPTERERKGKPPRASITIAVSQQEGDKVEIIVADDGAGIDPAKVRSAARKAGLIAYDEAHLPSDQEVLPLIFSSGISTSPFVTDVSGRGLGLTIVREKVERLGGVVSFETRAHEGTTLRISLPQTLARFRGLLVQAADQLFVIPSLNIERALTVTKSQIKTVENRETIQLQGQAVSLVRLADVLQLPKQQPPRDSEKKLPAIVLASANTRIAFLVDEVLHEQEVLVKSLGPQLCRVENISGATVLGNGKVVPILNPLGLMKSAVRATRAATKPEPVAGKKGEEKKKSVLVVEDSITARTLLKNILEMSGYIVATAVDGVDAFTQLRTNEFDVVLSDVDMPRMNGFELTARIRQEKKFAELPVVLLTALESREDKERGIDVGANAYLVKSSFDQSNLLEVLQKLL